MTMMPLPSAWLSIICFMNHSTTVSIDYLHPDYFLPFCKLERHVTDDAACMVVQTRARTPCRGCRLSAASKLTCNIPRQPAQLLSCNLPRGGVLQGRVLNAVRGSGAHRPGAGSGRCR